MTPLTLLDVDQLSRQDRDTLAAIMACYGVYPIAIYPDGAMHCLVPAGLEDAFLATVSRDVAPIEIVEAALVA